MGDTVSSYPGHRPLPAPGTEIGNYSMTQLIATKAIFVARFFDFTVTSF